MLMRIMYIMLNVPGHLKDMLRRLDSCMSKNFWPISLIPSCRDAARILLICTRYPAHDFTQHTPRRHKKPVIVFGSSLSVQDEIVAQRISDARLQITRHRLGLNSHFRQFPF